MCIIYIYVCNVKTKWPKSWEESLGLPLLCKVGMLSFVTLVFDLTSRPQSVGEWSSAGHPLPRNLRERKASFLRDSKSTSQIKEDQRYRRNQSGSLSFVRVREHLVLSKAVTRHFCWSPSKVPSQSWFFSDGRCVRTEDIVSSKRSPNGESCAFSAS